MIEKHNLQQITNLHLILFLRLPCWQPATRAPEESMQLTMKQLRDNKKSWNSQPFQHLSTSFNICHSTCHPRSCRVRHSCSCQQLNDHRSRHGNAVDLRASRCEAQRAISDLTGTVAWLKLITGSVWHWCRKYDTDAVKKQGWCCYNKDTHKWIMNLYHKSSQSYHFQPSFPELVQLRDVERSGYTGTTDLCARGSRARRPKAKSNSGVWQNGSSLNPKHP